MPIKSWNAVLEYSLQRNVFWHKYCPNAWISGRVISENMVEVANSLYHKSVSFCSVIMVTCGRALTWSRIGRRRVIMLTFLFISHYSIRNKSFEFRRQHRTQFKTSNSLVFTEFRWNPFIEFIHFANSLEIVWYCRWTSSTKLDLQDSYLQCRILETITVLTDHKWILHPIFC